MNNDPVRVSRIDWFAVAPLLRIVQSIPLGLRPRALLVALAVVMLCHFAFSGSPSLKDSVIRLNPGAAEALPYPLNVIHDSSFTLVFDTDWKQLVHLVLVTMTCALGTMLISLFAAARFGSQRSQSFEGGLARALRLLRRTLISTTVVVVMALILAGGFRSLVWVIGVESDSDSASAGVVILLVARVLLVLLFRILMTAGLLSTIAITIERDSAFEGLSRAINYVLSAPWYAFAIVVGSVVTVQVSSTVLTEFIAVSELVLADHNRSVQELVFQFGTPAHRPLASTVELSVFLSGMSIGYLLLRQSVDGVPLDEMDGGQRKASA